MAGEKFERPIQKVEKIFNFHPSVTTVYLKYFFFHIFPSLSLINYGCCINNLPGAGKHLFPQRKVLLFYGLNMHTAVHIVSILDRCGICSCVLQRESVRLKLKNKKVSKELLQWWPSVQSGNPYAPTLIYH